jgi:alpha-ribazole phosphatase
MAFHVDLLRHGDTGRHGFRGQLDDPLTAQGWAQMRAAVADGEWDVVVASPLQRCAAFARELAGARGLPLQLDPRWREYHFGDWQDVPVESLAQERGEALARFWADPAAHPPPGAEAFADFAARVQAALEAAVAREGRVLVVTHGGPIRWLHCHAAGAPPSRMSAIEVAHASLHRFQGRSSGGLPVSAARDIGSEGGVDVVATKAESA